MKYLNLTIETLSKVEVSKSLVKTNSSNGIFQDYDFNTNPKETKYPQSNQA